MKKLSTIVLCLLAAACAPHVADEPNAAINHAVAPLPSAPNPSRTNVGIQELSPVDYGSKAVVSSSSLNGTEDSIKPRSLKLDDPYEYPASTSAKTAADSFEEHTVALGDTVYSLARRYETTPKDIIALNNLPAPHGLNVGQKVKIRKIQRETKAVLPPRLPQSAQRLWNVPQRQAGLYLPRDRKGALMAWPVQGRVVADYGDVGKGQRNDGINIAAAKGSPVRAADNGIVAYVGDKIKGFGNLVLLRHPGGFVTAYAHNDKITVRPGSYVKRGETIALVGNTGAIDEPQVHFQVRKGKSPVDPLAYLERVPATPNTKPELLASRKMSIFGEYN
jgi:LysM repeat protein